ncbi:tRNA lysidine(34) synthetase TilS [Methylobacterium radiodurans]|uniref:tRNA(Ile)-lysidine synthase n=1 Tax=Methylobacterium radiodurans TaxID=2202828 RepID=A0A2U8VXU5_9HYPH|nr:tRNA lysidine(34) synthetase TilS [Methylobacterium radiodurans]AWN38288.1 tRNA lysidine(34) synthetase TilS [Methylobacterium radiodurans]
MSGEPGDALRAALAPHLTEPCLLAVSGGPDSTALMHAAAETCDPATLRAATVDHALRPEARAEAEAVARQAAALGISHSILTWEPDGPPPRTGIQAAARAARYRLLAAHAAETGAARLLTAHTRDDQAETVLMRLCAGSGPAGLAGMRPVRALGAGLVLARPFLALRKADLVAWCEARGVAYHRDPSNQDDRFARARLRRVLPLLAGEGLSAERLARLAERAARDDDALGRIAEDALSRLEHSGEGALDGRALAALPEAVALRVLDRALDRAGAAAGRLDRLERLGAALLPALREGRALRRTFRGFLIAADPGGTIRLAPAPPRAALRGDDLLGNG